MLSAFLAMFAGIGFIFIGVRISGANLKHAIGPGIRRWLVALVRTRIGSAFGGLVLGAITQSANGGAFIATSLAAAGVIGAVEAMPMAAWASVGVTLKIVLATLDIHPIVLVAVIVSGIGYYLNLHTAERWRSHLGILFGLALLFFGVHETKVAGGELAEFETTKQFVALSQRYYLLSLPVGLVLGFVLHNSTTATVIAVALGTAGLFGVQETVLISLGSGVGAAIAGLIEFAAFRGRMRQIAYVYVASKTIGPLVLLPVVLVEHFTGQPMLLSALGADEGAYASVVIAVYALTQTAGAVIVTLLLTPLQRIIGRLSPASEAEALGQPQHLAEIALAQPDLALALARREQGRLLRFLPLYLPPPEALDGEPRAEGDREAALAAEEVAGDDDEAPPKASKAQPAAPDPATLREAARNLTEEIAQYLRRVAEADPGPADLAEIARRDTTNDLLDGMHDAMHDLAEGLAAADDPALQHVRVALREGVDALLTEAFALLDKGARMDRAAFQKLTADRSALMEAMRQRTLEQPEKLSPEGHAALFAMTSATEHLVWLLGRYGLLAARAPHLRLGRLAA